MKAWKILTGLGAAAFFFAACCSKKGACPAIEFNTIELYNFRSADVNDSVTLLVYEGQSSFTKLKDSSFVKVESTSDTNVFRINTGSMSVNNDYLLRVIRLGKTYKITNFTGNKITCGKCFLRNNNQYGYELSGYTVNGRYFNYDAAINVMK
ncbi:MAG: hypothetical protein QM743_07280 [Chitinophagaceae bacterium]